MIADGSSAKIRIGASLLAVLGALGCASTLSESEPPSSRPPNVVGLAPLPIATTPAPSAARRAVADESSTAQPGTSEPGTGSAEERAAARIRNEACIARAGTLAIKRVALSRTLDAGLGSWLQGVDVEAKVDRGRFQGWLVRSIYAGDPCWASIDLRGGDIVSRINRRPIERPEEAQAVWTALRTSGEIVIDFVRDGRPRTLKFAIVD